MIISLSGFMGCGKSTVGKELQQLLPDFQLIDLDEFIEEGDGRSIAEIFEEDGERAFREMETDALECMMMVYPSSGQNLILSLGGGTLMKAENAKMIQAESEIFYLKASIDTLVSNLENNVEERPLLEGGDLRKKVETLMKRRAATYEKTADHIIITDEKDFSSIAREICELIK